MRLTYFSSSLFDLVSWGLVLVHGLRGSLIFISIIKQRMWRVAYNYESWTLIWRFINFTTHVYLLQSTVSIWSSYSLDYLSSTHVHYICMFRSLWVSDIHMLFGSWKHVFTYFVFHDNSFILWLFSWTKNIYSVKFSLVHYLISAYVVYIEYSNMHILMERLHYVLWD